MRRDLVEAALAVASDLLFEDVLYTHAPDAAVTIVKAISGVEVAPEPIDTYGQQVRVKTFVTRALKASFPNLAAGDTIDDGVDSYTVLDFRPVGDGRFEIEISLAPVA